MPAVDESALCDDLALIRETARAAGEIAMRYFKGDPQVWMKGGNSPVSEADFAVDLYLRETLTAARPDYGWLSEEMVDHASRLGARRTFVVDPIDGTRAFLEGRTTWCISVAVVEAGRPIAGILDCPAKQEMFEAALGGPALKNGSPISVGSDRGQPVVAGPKNVMTAMPAALSGRVTTHPYIPSLAYRLAMVADGRLDATFVKANSHDWDLAAADLILHLAGGAVLERDGTVPLYADGDARHGVLVAGSGDLLAEMAAVIAALPA